MSMIPKPDLYMEKQETWWNLTRVIDITLVIVAPVESGGKWFTPKGPLPPMTAAMLKEPISPFSPITPIFQEQAWDYAQIGYKVQPRRLRHARRDFDKFKASAITAANLLKAHDLPILEPYWLRFQALYEHCYRETVQLRLRHLRILAGHFKLESW